MSQTVYDTVSDNFWKPQTVSQSETDCVASDFLLELFESENLGAACAWAMYSHIEVQDLSSL